jgi:hypothetical protein
VEEFGADAVVEPHAARHVLDVGTDLLAQIRHLVDELMDSTGNTQGQPIASACLRILPPPTTESIASAGTPFLIANTVPCRCVVNTTSVRVMRDSI